MYLIDTHLPIIHMSLRLYHKGNPALGLMAVFKRNMSFNDGSCQGHCNTGRVEIGSEFS
jgi:hypothetical protein